MSQLGNVCCRALKGLLCVFLKLVRRASRSSPVQKTDVEGIASPPAVSGRQRVDASGGKATTKV